MTGTKKPKPEPQTETVAADPFAEAERLQAEAELANGQRFLRLAVKLADGWLPSGRELADELALLERSPAALREAVERIRKRDELLKAFEAASKAREEVERLAGLLAEAEAERDRQIEAFEAERVEPLVSQIQGAEGRARGGLQEAELRKRLIELCPDDSLRAERLRILAEIEAARREAMRHIGRPADGRGDALREELRAVEDSMAAFDPRRAASGSGGSGGGGAR